MRSFISTLFLVLILLPAWAQPDPFRLDIESFRVESRFLSPEISALALDFDDARLDDAFGLLPVYIKRIPLKQDNVSIRAVLSEEVTGNFQHASLAEVAEIEKIREDFIIRTSLVYQEGMPFAEVLILPFRNYSGDRVEVLLSGTVTIELRQQQAATGFKSGFVTESVLAEGQWYRLTTDETGIYRISYDMLVEMGIDPSSIDPRKIRIFGNGNGIVPEKNSVERHDDLTENPILVMGEDDGVFDEEDYILFYGLSSIKWQFVPFQGYNIFLHEINPYTQHSTYFLNIGEEDGQRVSPVNYSGLEPTVYVNQFSDHAVHENEEVNILKTGRQWYGERYSDETVYEYSFNFPNIVDDYKISMQTNVAARSTIESTFNFYQDDQLLLEAPVSKIIVGTTVYAWTSTPDTVGFYPDGDEVRIRVEYDKPGSTSIGWMNYIALNARRYLTFNGAFMSFRDHLSVADSAVAEFRISGSNDQMQVWDVTDIFSISSMAGEYSENIFRFRAPAEEIREYIAFDGSGFLEPVFVEEVSNQNLHALEPVEYIIVSHPDFMEQSQRMLSLHQQLDGMSGIIIQPQEIYNEFSSGNQDPAAIRDFIRMLYEKNDRGNKSMYLLLMGDASYDYLDRLADNTNFVPTYQSIEGLKLGYSFVTDDFFGMLDPDEGVNAFGKSVEIGIGRFPVHTVEQADQMVNKVEAYLTMMPNVFGNWRNRMYFVADDEDQNTHFTQAEKLQYVVDTTYHVINRYKIYMDAFPQVTTPSGSTYPDVNEAIDRMMDNGSLIVNYTGHGGEGGWAHEGVLNIQMINSWENWDRLPLFITATCEFSRFDDPSLISAGEQVFLNPRGGGIGLLTTTRLAWSDPNFRLNRAVYKFMFRQDDGEYHKIGDIVRLAKTDQNNGSNIKNFVLLGDPAMRLAYPELNAVVTEINGIDVDFPDDTLSAMSEVIVKGIITDHLGDTVKDFSGRLCPTVYDQNIMMSTLGNDGGSFPAQFHVLGPVLYEGKVSVENGCFSFNYFLPQNMNTELGYGRLSLYAHDTLYYRDAHGYYSTRNGGVNPDIGQDTQGPELSLYLDHSDFVSGDLCQNDPVFMAHLYDEHGINFTGNGIGRDISLTLDHDPETTVILNSVFDPVLDSYQEGWVSYPFDGLEDGKHTLTLKAWDNMNNMSEKTIEFEVSVDSQVALSGVKNYPNPFSDITYFTFDHNKPGNNFDVEIRIFDIKGQLVNILSSNVAAEGLSVSPLSWDGTDSGGTPLGNGVYIYRLFVTDEQGTQYVQTSKLIFTGEK